MSSEFHVIKHHKWSTRILNATQACCCVDVQAFGHSLVVQMCSLYRRLQLCCDGCGIWMRMPRIVVVAV